MIRNNQHKEEMQNIVAGLWQISNSARGEMSARPVHVLLYLLSGYRDGLFLNFKDGFNNHSFDLVQETKKVFISAENYSDINPFFLDLIDQIQQRLLERIFMFMLRLDMQFLKENSATIFDSVLASLQDGTDVGPERNFQPLELSRFIMNVADLSDDAKVYNPFAGLATFSTFLKSSQTYFGQEIITSAWALGRLRQLAYGNKDATYLNEDSIKSWDFNGKYNLIVTRSPFQIRGSNLNSALGKDSLSEFIITNGLNSLSKNGKLIVIFPQSFLSSSSTRDKDFRRNLIERNLIETVVSLPGRILSYAAVNLCIIVIRKNQEPSERIRMIDASSFVKKSSHRKETILDDEKLWKYINSNNNSEFIRYIEKSEIERENFDLQVGRYFIDENISGTRLGDFASFATGTAFNQNSAIRASVGIDVYRDENSVKFVRIKDLKNDPFNSNLDLTQLVDELPSNGSFRIIRQNCLLISSRFTSLKPTYFNYEGVPICISGDIYALCIDESQCDVRYLIYALHASSVTKQIQLYTSGQVMPRISRKDLLNLKVELPSLGEQTNQYIKLAQQHLSTKSEQYDVVLQEQILNVNDENSFLRHQIAGSLKNVKSAFDFVQKILAEKVNPQIPGLYDLKADERLPSVLDTYLKIIERDLHSINRSVNKIGDQIDLMEMSFEEFDLMEFLQNYTESLGVRGFNFYEVIFNFEEEIFDDENVKKVFVRGDKDFLRKAFDNIVENAEKHGFNKWTPNTNKMWIYPMFDFENMSVQVDFANTGNRLPENMPYDSMVRKGSSMGENAGDGIGMWYVNEVMKLHGGEFGFTDETGREGIGGEYVTSIELTIPIIEVNEKL